MKRAVFRNISARRHTQPIQSNCCYFPLAKVKRNEVYQDELYSDSLRTRVIFQDARHKELSGFFKPVKYVAAAELGRKSSAGPPKTRNLQKDLNE